MASAPTQLHASPVPQRLGSLELLGEAKGSGFATARFLVRGAGDGRVMQLSSVLYALVCEIDGERSTEAIAAALTERLERPVSADNVEYLVEQKLSPLGLATLDREPARPDAMPDLLLRVHAKRPLFSAGVVQRVARLLRPAFYWPVVVVGVGLFVWFDIAIFFFSPGVLSGATRDVLSEPSAALVVLLLVYGSAVVHEFGHAGACAFGGAKPGAIGGGFYVFIPALFTDVNDSYRLGRAGRVRTDLGGVYFNALFALVLVGVYFAIGWAPLLLAAAMMNLLIAQQLLPFVRFDGYWLVSDVAGVPDLFLYFGLALRFLVRPSRLVRRALDRFKPATRRLVITWAGVTVVVLVVQFGLLLLFTPAVARAMLEATVDYARYTRDQLDDGTAAGVAFGVLSVLLGLVFFVGIVYGTALLIFRAARSGIRRFGSSPGRRIAVTVVVVALFAAPMTFSVLYVGSRASPSGL